MLLNQATEQTRDWPATRTTEMLTEVPKIYREVKTQFKGPAINDDIV